LSSTVSVGARRMPANFGSFLNTSERVARARAVCSRLDVLAEAVYCDVDVSIIVCGIPDLTQSLQMAVKGGAKVVYIPKHWHTFHQCRTEQLAASRSASRQQHTLSRR
jgi:hypothetical protein